MPAKKTVKKTSNKKSPVKKVASKKTVSKKSEAKKVTTKKASAKKVTAKKVTAKKVTAKKAAPKKAKKVVRYEESQFLASIKPYALKKNEKYMNAKQKQHFQDILSSWREQLQTEQLIRFRKMLVISLMSQTGLLTKKNSHLS